MGTDVGFVYARQALNYLIYLYSPLGFFLGGWEGGTESHSIAQTDLKQIEIFLLHPLLSCAEITGVVHKVQPTVDYFLFNFGKKCLPLGRNAFLSYTKFKNKCHTDLHCKHSKVSIGDYFIGLDMKGRSKTT